MRPRKVSGKPPEVTRRLRNGGWVLTESWTGEIAAGVILCVRKGYLYDLASVPRLLTVIPGFGKDEMGLVAPLAHDALYQTGGNHPGVFPRQQFSRGQVDLIFRRLMRADEVGRIRSFLAWLAVRLGGWLAWRKCSVQ
uniref:DUF1353 domain-containing protein n=1 Tax=viral metagenome TaxID=1070528 RepID=A0A6M3LGT7_9ZZZZ